MLFQFLLIIHVMSAMLWFGGTMSVPRRIRVALDSEITSARAQLGGLVREGRMMAGAAFVLFVTGISLVMARGGFAGLQVRYHIGLTLSVVWIVIGATAVRSTLEKLGEAAQGEALAEGTDDLRKRIAMLTGIQHALFTAIAVLMLWRMG